MNKFHQQDIKVGEEVRVVVVEAKGEVEEVATVEEVVSETYYSVAFDDGTFCDSLDPEEVKHEGLLELNSQVKGGGWG